MYIKTYSCENGGTRNSGNLHCMGASLPEASVFPGRRGGWVLRKHGRILWLNKSITLKGLLQLESKYIMFRTESAFDIWLVDADKQDSR